MKIAFLISGLHEGGAERVVTVLANEMYRRGHEVCVFVTWSEKCVYTLDTHIPIIPIYQDFPTEDSYKNKRYHYKKEIKKRHLRIKYKASEEYDKQLEIWKLRIRYSDKAKVLAKYLNNNRIDVLYSFMDGSNIIAGLCKSYTKARVIISQRIYNDYSNLDLPNNAIIDYAYRKADAIVFQTNEQKYAFSPKVQEKGIIIFNPVKKELPTPFFGKRESIMVNYCRLAEQKNLPLLIKTFYRISQEYKDFKLEIYGSGNMQSELNDLIVSMNLQNRAKLIPFDRNIHQKIGQYSMFVMTSDYEGMPNSLLEAMAIGLPVISTDCLGGGARAVIRDGINGQLVPVNDEEALYHSMKKYIEDNDFAMNCGNNAIQIREDLSVERITDQWLMLAKR